MRASTDSLFLRPDLDALQSAAPPVTDVRGDVQAAIDRMLDLVSRGGYPALAGPQIGFRGRVVVADLTRTGRRPIVLINPVVTSMSREAQADIEGCHHLPGVRVRLRRPVQITVDGRARSGQPVQLELGGLLGRIIQHQIDHLDGRLLTDHAGTDTRGTVRDRAAAPPRCPVAI